MLKITLIRHGKTAGNLRREYIGSTDLPLCDEGLAEFSRKFRDADIIFSSPMKRCRQTAALIFPNVEPIFAEDLRECDFGDFEGKNHEELENSPAYRAWIDERGVKAPPNGEGGEEFCARCAAAFLEVVRLSLLASAESAAIVCHGGTIMAILDKFSHPNEEFYHWQAENLGGYTFDFDEESGQAQNIERLKGNL